MDNVELRSCIRRAKRGDGEAFCQALEALRPRLLRVALCYLHGQDDALEALSEAACRAYAALGGLRQEAYFSTWVTAILMNVCRDMLRRQGRECPLTGDFAAEGDGFAHLELREAVDKLPDELRAVIALRYFGGLTVAETAAALQLPEGTVKTRSRAALRALRVELA